MANLPYRQLWGRGTNNQGKNPNSVQFYEKYIYRPVLHDARYYLNDRQILNIHNEINNKKLMKNDPKGLRDRIMKDYKERTINSAELVSLITFWYLASSISKLEIYNVSCLYIK